MSTLPFTEYHQSGYSVIPVITTSAAPFEKDWSRWSTQRQAQAVVEEYEKKYRLPTHGVGLVLGPASGIVALDIDSESKDILDLCPPSPVRKRGSKGETRFFRPAPGLTNVRAKRPNTGPNKDKEKQEGVELLGAGCQTVIPPSINRKTNQPYIWVTPDTLLDVKPEDLPLLTQEELDRVARYITGSVAGTEGSGSSAGAGSGIQGAAGRNEALTKVVWSMLHSDFSRHDSDIATELVGIDSREFGANAYFSDPNELWAKKHKTPFAAAYAFVKYHRKQLAKKGTPNPRKTIINMSPASLKLSAPGDQGDQGDQGETIDLSRLAMWEQLGLEVSDSNKPKCNIDAAHKVLSGVPAFRDAIWFDSFYNNIMTSLPEIGESTAPPSWGRPWTDADTVFVVKYAQNKVGLDIGIEAANAALLLHAKSQKKHAVRDWLGGLPAWDMQPRMGTFMSRYLGAEQNPYTNAAGCNFLVSLVARVMRPGCKADCMPILEGVQGLLKSTALRTLVGDHWFGELTSELDDKDAYIALRGRWLVEIPELDSILKADPKTVKRVLSTQSDRFRPPYGRYAEDFPRQFIFAGTTNEEDYLKDPTGGRRFWPIACSKVDIQALASDREQLFAEALCAFKEGLPWWEMPESAKAEVAARTEHDAWFDQISTWLELPPQAQRLITTTLIATDCLQFMPSHIGQREKNRIANCMKMLGYRVHPAWDQASKHTIRVWKKG